MVLTPPSKKTLAKYGMNLADWARLAIAQKGVCAICKRLPRSERLVIDHEHVKGWAKLPPTERIKYVRGLLCFQDNRYLVAKNTRQTISAVADYLTRGGT